MLHPRRSRETTAAHRFRTAMLLLWQQTATFQRHTVIKDASEEAVAARASLASRVRTDAKDYLPDGQVCAQPREKWREVQRAFSAWWRPWTDENGERHVLLAMRCDLCNQIGVALPGVTDQASLTKLATRYGLAGEFPGVPDRLSGGPARLLILSLELTRDVLAVLLDDPPDDEEPLSDTEDATNLGQ
jgi:hypothetical protein